MHKALLLTSTLGFVLLVFVASSRGDATSDVLEPFDDTEEPITGTPAVAQPGTPIYEATAPYSIGGPAAEWSREQLGVEERAVADRGLNEDQTEVQSAYAAASVALAEKGRAEAAALSLGLDGPLDGTGVVP